MIKIIDEETIDEKMESYFTLIGDYHFVMALNNYSELFGFGIEDIWCCFANQYDEWEEDYFGESGVEFYFDYPAVSEDLSFILTYEEFYQYILEASERYIERHPEHKEIVKEHLDKIKMAFNI